MVVTLSMRVVVLSRYAIFLKFFFVGYGVVFWWQHGCLWWRPYYQWVCLEVVVVDVVAMVGEGSKHKRKLGSMGCCRDVSTTMLPVLY